MQSEGSGKTAHGCLTGCPPCRCPPQALPEPDEDMLGVHSVPGLHRAFGHGTKCRVEGSDTLYMYTTHTHTMHTIHTIHTYTTNTRHTQTPHTPITQCALQYKQYTLGNTHPHTHTAHSCAFISMCISHRHQPM